jgi:hypothetical protein
LWIAADEGVDLLARQFPIVIEVFEAERPGRLQVDDKLEFGRL